MAEKKRYVNPLDNLTAEQWERAMREGIRDAEAQSASVSRDIIAYYWLTRMPQAREELRKAESALRTYLEKPSSEPPDIPRHRRLAENLKRATDDLRDSTDAYVTLTLAHYPSV